MLAVYTDLLKAIEGLKGNVASFRRVILVLFVSG